MFLTFILHLCVFEPTNNISGQMEVHCFVLNKNLVTFFIWSVQVPGFSGVRHEAVSPPEGAGRSVAERGQW